MARAPARSGEAGRKSRAGAARGGPAPPRFRAKVRMYRHGLGDCMLVALPRGRGRNYYILIDCGVLLGTPDAEARMTRVLSDVIDTTHGRVDLLIGTHEHWDHLSGFVLARETFEQLKVDKVWLAWTENPEDLLAKELAAERATALAALRMSVSRLQLSGDEAGAHGIGSLLGFFGAVNGKTTKDALEAIRNKTPNPRYCDPQDAPVELRDAGARLYVLGPPRDEKLIRKTRPSGRHPETYHLALNAFRSHVEPGLGPDAPDAPFGTRYAIPYALAEEMDHFKRYWADESWRRIDTAWLDGSSELALQLDSATNNTCLVLAIELDGGDVLLFAADAQVGNWLSWQDLSWQVDGQTVTGPDLLQRTILYKVGHHGSHNATLREKGLEMMARLQLALIPVDQEMAQKMRWNRMPLPGLIDALMERTDGAVLRADKDPPAVQGRRVVANELYVEVEL